MGLGLRAISHLARMRGMAFLISSVVNLEHSMVSAFNMRFCHCPWTWFVFRCPF